MVLLLLSTGDILGGDGAAGAGDREAVAGFGGLPDWGGLGGSRIQGTMQEAIDGGTQRAVLRFGEGFGDGIQLGFKSDGESHGTILVRWCQRGCLSWP